MKSILANVFVATTAMAASITINTFGEEGCSADPINSVQLTDTACIQFGSGGQTTFDFTNLDLGPTCNIIFTQADPTCVDFDNVITPNDFQCFDAVGTLGSDAFASIFCS